MRALVTGAAGFIGSHLSAYLLAEGDDVVGVDSFTPYYPRELKELNLETIGNPPGFRFVETDLSSEPIEPLLDGVEVVYHLAAQPGVRASWGAEFGTYIRDNLQATQRILEACPRRSVPRFVYASSSSIYGDAESLPTRETDLPKPVSPYGVTKLAAEHLCEAYRASSGPSTASLRLFTVYGPRQRPDMAFSRLVATGLRGETFELYGDGEQTRDFTFVGDVVRAFRASAVSGWSGVANIGGGARTSLNEAIRIVSSLVGEVKVVRRNSGRGDVRHTGADVSLAHEAFGWTPKVALADGLRLMVEAAK